VYAEGPRLICRGEDDGSRSVAADDERLALQLGAAAELDTREERVHVGMQHGAPGVVARQLRL
jgi:hypothetical protein